MERPCEHCGKRMLNPSSRKRFCGSSCKARAHEAAKVTALRPAPDGTDAPDGPVVTSVRAELVDAGKEASSLGASALAIAARLDSGQEPGSAMAALNRELRATMAEALRGVVRSSVQVARDELAERRARA